MSSIPLSIDTRIALHNGVQIPLFGLGVYRSEEGSECIKAVNSALESGYRLIDTASFYDNEKSVGKAVRESGMARSEIFVTTKLWNTDHGYDNTLRAFEKSMDHLGLDVLDLYLVHYPVEKIRLETWKAMERILESGACRAIGVSNYLSNHLEELLANCNIAPMLNQIELSPYCYESRIETIELCRANQIVVEAYSPLVRTQKFDDPKLVALATKYQKTPAQILLRWALQENIVVIPKSSNPKRIQENAALYDFEISKDDMAALRALDENFIVCWDPSKTS